MAAEELAVTATAISHQIRHLERLLGIALFERRARRVLLTPEGRTLLPALREGFDVMSEALAPLMRSKRRRIITLSATPAFVVRLLVPKLAAFQAIHADFDLRLHASTQLVDFATQQIDAAVRYGEGPYRGLQHESLLHARFAPTCSPVLNIRSHTDLAHHPLLHFQWQPGITQPSDWAAWKRVAGLRKLDITQGITFSDEAHAIEAAIAGQGVAMLDTSLVAEELKRGTLMTPFGPELDGLDYHLVHPPATQDDAVLSALREWLHNLT